MKYILMQLPEVMEDEGRHYFIKGYDKLTDQVKLDIETECRRSGGYLKSSSFAVYERIKL